MRTASTDPVDVRVAGQVSRDLLERAAEMDWSRQAGVLEWDCRATAAHISDALAFYAGHLAARASDWLKFDVVPHADASNRHLARLVDAMAELLAQTIEATPPEVRAYHHSGMWDRHVFAAMGCLEALVHTGDIATGLQVSFEGPPDVCARVNECLFPTAPRDADAWSVLWWATGRGDLSDQPHLGPDWERHWWPR